MNNDNFVVLIDHVSSTFRLSFPETKNKFSTFPLCLIYYIENNENEPMIEVRFDKEKATITCFFDDQNKCDMVSLCFDTVEDEDLFIKYLNEIAEYNYRKKYWQASQFWVRLDVTDGCNVFIFYV